jgi:hypothetical protein
LFAACGIAETTSHFVQLALMFGRNQATNGDENGGHGGRREREESMKTSPVSAKAEAEVQTAYRKRLQIAKDRLLTITHAIELRDHARQQEGCRGRPAQWDQVGSIVHVNALLRDLCAFLGTDAAEDPE